MKKRRNRGGEGSQQFPSPPLATASPTPYCTTTMHPSPSQSSSREPRAPPPPSARDKCMLHGSMGCHASFHAGDVREENAPMSSSHLYYSFFALRSARKPTNRWHCNLLQQVIIVRFFYPGLLFVLSLAFLAKRES